MYSPITAPFYNIRFVVLVIKMASVSKYRRFKKAKESFKVLMTRLD